MKVKYFDIFGLRGNIKMSVNPPQCIVDANFHIVLDGVVHQYVGIGWVPVRDATPEDENLPQVFSPHCSQCKHYDVLKDKKMYCFKSHKCITARKRPCKDYSEQ